MNFQLTEAFEDQVIRILKEPAPWAPDPLTEPVSDAPPATRIATVDVLNGRKLMGSESFRAKLFPKQDAKGERGAEV